MSEWKISDDRMATVRAYQNHNVLAKCAEQCAVAFGPTYDADDIRDEAAAQAKHHHGVAEAMRMWLYSR